MTRAAAWVVAAAGFALTLATFWPGYLSWDSAYQWWQARGGALDPAHPPVMVRTWQLVRMVLPDPGGMLAVPAAIWWVAMAIFANALGGSAWRRGATVALLGAWPPLFALLPHLWKDVWMSALFALAVACLAAEARVPRPGERAPHRTAWRWVAVAALTVGCAFRFNALPAVIPLVAWLGFRATGKPWTRMGRRVPGPLERGVSQGFGLLAVVWLGGVFLNHSPNRDVPVWPSVALWDLAAVSIAEDRVLFPPDWIEPSLTVADLRRDFSPHVNVPSFANGQLKLNYYFDYTPAQYAELRAAWLRLPLDHPRAYFAHRAEVGAYLFGLRQAAHPDGSVLSPGVVAFKDNPPLAPNDGALNRTLQPALSSLVDTPLFAGWPYAVLALGLAAVWGRTWRRGGARGADHAAAGALSGVVALSALALAAPLPLLAPAADFRYLMWTVLAALMAGALRLAAPSPISRRP